MQSSILTLLVIALVMANLPFATTRIAGIKKVKHKRFGWYLLEWFLLYGLTALFARYLESQQMPVHKQGWSFYVATIALFIVLAFPGFVARYFWRWHPGK